MNELDSRFPPTPLFNATGILGGICVLIALVALTYGILLMIRKTASLAPYVMLALLPATLGGFFGFVNLTLWLERAARNLEPAEDVWWSTFAGDMYIGFLGMGLSCFLLLFGLIVMAVRGIRRRPGGSPYSSPAAGSRSCQP